MRAEGPLPTTTVSTRSGNSPGAIALAGFLSVLEQASAGRKAAGEEATVNVWEQWSNRHSLKTFNLIDVGPALRAPGTRWTRILFEYSPYLLEKQGWVGLNALA